MRIGPHTHPCVTCGAPSECCGEISPNVDGWPAFACEAYHLPNGELADDFRCDDCQERLDEACARLKRFQQWTARKSFTGGA